MSRYFNIDVAQHPYQIGATLDRLVRYDIKLFVELGIYRGGLTQIMLLWQEWHPGFAYWGIDRDKEQVDPSLRDDLRISYLDFWKPENVDYIAHRMCNTHGAVMVFVDGGDKPKELELFAPKIRQGDFIQVHDYPAEVSPEFLDKFNVSHPYLQEQEWLRENMLPYWRRIS